MSAQQQAVNGPQLPIEVNPQSALIDPLVIFRVSGRVVRHQ